MSEVARRTLAELAARYTLEPTLRDVFVEGWLDSRVMRWVAKELDARSAAVYEIDSVEIPANDLANLGLPDNSRSRVIFLALHLANELSHETFAVTCIADSDFDRLIRTQITCGLLLYTELTSMDMYFFSSDVLEKALKTGAGINIDVVKTLESIEPILRKLFVFRCANILLGWGMSWYAPWKCIRLEDEHVSFDEGQFIDRYLNKNARAGRKEEFLAKVDEISGTDDSKDSIRGHDTFETLAWLLSKRGFPTEFCCAEVILALAVSSTALPKLLEFDLFQQLRTRLCSRP